MTSGLAEVRHAVHCCLCYQKDGASPPILVFRHYLSSSIPADNIRVTNYRGVDMERLNTRKHDSPTSSTFNTALWDSRSNEAPITEPEIVPRFSRLLDLTDELLLGIIEQVEKAKDLCNFALTCLQIQALVEPFIYRSILIRTGGQADNLVRSIKARPVRASAIQTLEIRYIFTAEHNIEALNLVLTDLRNLRHLTIESPCLNNGPWRNSSQPWESKCRIDYCTLFEAASLKLPPSAPRAIPLLQSSTQPFQWRLCQIFSMRLDKRINW